MGRGYEMKWQGLTGTIEGESFCAVLDLKETRWDASINDEGGELQTRTFEEGELEQAHEWCITKLKEHDEGNSKAGRGSEGAS